MSAGRVLKGMEGGGGGGGGRWESDSYCSELRRKVLREQIFELQNGNSAAGVRQFIRAFPMQNLDL